MKRHSHRHPHSHAAHDHGQGHAPIAERLREGSRKLTGPRRAIIAALQEEAHPMTIREIHECIGKTECDLATIYRSMHMLEKMGIVKRFDFGDGIARFEVLCCEASEHHHHLVCTDCAKVVEIEECFPEELERRIAVGNGFAQITHKLEFFGVCPECQGNGGLSGRGRGR